MAAIAEAKFMKNADEENDEKGARINGHNMLEEGAENSLMLIP